MERLTIRLNEVACRCAKISTNLCCEYNDCALGPIDHLRELVQAEKDGLLAETALKGSAG